MNFTLDYHHHHHHHAPSPTNREEYWTVLALVALKIEQLLNAKCMLTLTNSVELSTAGKVRSCADSR
jgi:hypothetical protein